MKVTGLQPVQVLAVLVGLFFLVVGVIGLVRTGFGDFTGHQHGTLLGFAINPLHNIVHVVIGLFGVLLGTRSGGARLFGWLLLAGYGVVFVWGLMITGVFSSNPVSGLGNPLNLNTADNWLHLGAAVAGLLIAVLPARKKVRLDEPEEAPAATEADRTVVDRPGKGRHGLGAHG
ncbi:DUF4383 domain-containing protein [Amycolatopsis nigrescens]|uniref:DUF4383 domain-containing protein n=1 Tax=Amycolatopsis nigrescens TaxID=381445 RepID=UPI000369FD69|nr:DUF4383 domain-containing protein [Amycolatopsis nigrescens]